MKTLSELTLKQKGTALIGLLLLLELAFVGILTLVLIQSEQATRFEASAKDIVIGLNQVIFDIMKVEHFSFRFIGTAQQENRIEFWKALPHAREDMKILLSCCQDFPSIKERSERVAMYLTRSMDLEERMVLMFMAGQHGPANDLRRSAERDRKGHELIAEIKTLQDEMQPIIKEQAALASQSQSSVMLLLLFGFACNVVLAVYLALAFVKGITSRIVILADNSRRLAADQELHPPLGQDDEIGKLDSMFHKMAAEVKESARKERLLTDNAQDAICSMNENGRLLMVNPAASKHWGYSREVLLEKPVFDFIEKDNLDRFKQLLQSGKTANREIAQETECRIVSQNGKTADTIWSLHWSDDEKCFFCVVHDITERKQAERLLRASEARARTVLNSMLVGLLTLSADGTIASVNPRTEQLMQFSEDELAGKPLSRLFSQIDIEPQHLKQLECKRKDGSTLQIELWLTELPGKSLRDNFLVNILDVSARHEIQKAKQEFVAMVRNDLRTPLSAVEQYLKNFSSESQAKLLEDGKRKSELAMANIGGLLRLLDDLLEINNLESGQLALNCQQTDLCEVIHRSLEAVSGFAEQHKVKLQFEETGALPVWADPDRLGRIIINLLSNAIKFSPTDETVTVKAESSESELCIKIIDRGRGVPDNHKELIFERFKQVKSSDATQKGGSGLGLAICKAIIEQHGGTIAVDSEEGKGSCFWFRIPRQMRVESV